MNQIGEAAGIVWRQLDRQGPLTVAKLRQGTKLPEPLLLMGLGWLAREGKLDLEQDGKTLRIALRHPD